MKYIFIVQGEGRGHMTQALTLAGLLRSKGHQIVKVLVGKSPSRKLPDFFMNGINAPVVQFESMNFMPSADNRKPSMVTTVLFNSFNNAVDLAHADRAFFTSFDDSAFQFCGVKRLS